MNVVVVMTGDEEDSGDPLSAAREALVAAAEGADLAIGFEDGPADPKLAVTARRGTTGWEVRVHRHAGALVADLPRRHRLRRRLRDGAHPQRFREKMAGEAHLTFNPGVMLGGTTVEFDPVQLRGTAFGKTNVVAEHAVVSGDLRALSREQFEKAQADDEEIVAASLPHTPADDHLR